MATLLVSACGSRHDTSVAQPAITATIQASTAIAGGGFALLPQKAQYLVSGDIGKDQPAYHARSNSAGGFQMGLPHQNLHAELSEVRGWQISASGFEWGLKLTGWGFGDVITTVENAFPTAVTNRVEFARGPLTEWYRNGPWGMQQGFTLDAPPTVGSSDEPLTLVLQQYGDLYAEVDHDACGMQLRTDNGELVLRYSGLLAWDAGGRALPAWMESDGEHLRLRVQASDAQYPLTIDPWANTTQTAKLTAADAAENDLLGISVSVSEDASTIVAGAPGDDNEKGSVYVWVNSGSWSDATQSAKLTADDAAASDDLGYAVAVSDDGSTIAAGAAGENGSKGSVYVWVKSGGSWSDATQDAKLTAPILMGPPALLGTNVSISDDGSTIASGARQQSLYKGAVYVWVNSGSWSDATPDASLTASDAANGDLLGYSVSISDDGSTVAAGSRNDGGGKGSVYVWVNSGSWSDATQNAKLTASDAAANDNLGDSISISDDGNTIASGADNEDPDDIDGAGSIYVWVKAGSWSNATQDAKLTADDAAASDTLGYSISTSNDGSAIAAGSRNDGGGKGSVYVWVKSGASWSDATQNAKLTTSDAAANDKFGDSISISDNGNTIAVGGKNVDPSGIDAAGSVYVFVLTATPTSAPIPTITPTSTALTDDDEVSPAATSIATASTVAMVAPIPDTFTSSSGTVLERLPIEGGGLLNIALNQGSSIESLSAERAAGGAIRVRMNEDNAAGLTSLTLPSGLLEGVRLEIDMITETDSLFTYKEFSGIALYEEDKLVRDGAGTTLTTLVSDPETGQVVAIPLVVEPDSGAVYMPLQYPVHVALLDESGRPISTVSEPITLCFKFTLLTTGDSSGANVRVVHNQGQPDQEVLTPVSISLLADGVTAHTCVRTTSFSYFTVVAQIPGSLPTTGFSESMKSCAWTWLFSPRSEGTTER